MKAYQYTFLAICFSVIGGQQALAAGFALNSQSATGIGRAFSGEAAIGDNASVLSRNPSAMALFSDKALSFGLTYADIEIKIEDPVLNPGNEQLQSIDDAGDGKFIPNLFYLQPVGERWAFGFGLFSNFGTGSDTFSLVGAPDILVGNTEITTVNFNTSFSFRINKHFSLGGGIDVIYGNGKLTRGSGLDRIDNLLDVEGSGWGLGGIVGALYEINDNHRLGASYRYSPDIRASGDVDLLTSAAGEPLVSFDELEVPLPDIFQFAGFHQLATRWALHYTAQWTGWSDFNTIKALDGESIRGPIGDVELKEYAWKDSWLFSIGGTFTINPRWTVRAGYMRDNGVVDDISSLSIPDSDRNWYTAGFGFGATPQSVIDFGLAIIRGEDTEVTEPGFFNAVTATTSSNAVYYSVQYSYRFGE